MSLFRKLGLLFGFIILVVLSATLALVYFESRTMLINMTKEKAVSIIQTITSEIENNVPDYQFEHVLLDLKSKDPNILSFDIYKLNDFFYDIASTNPNRIGTQSNAQSFTAAEQRKVLAALHGTVLEITAPIQGYHGVPYSAVVRVSVAGDLQSVHSLLAEVLLIGLCAMILAGLAVWYFTREFLSKPVLAVVSAANAVAAGNLQVDLAQSQRRRDEIGSLARSFHRMTESLQQLLGLIAETAADLNREFEELVDAGDYSARGTLHVSDVMSHVAQSVQDQVAYLTRLRDNLELAQVSRAWSASGFDDLKEWCSSVDDAIVQAQGIARDLGDVVSTADGQLGAVQEVNRAAARLSEMAVGLGNLIATFEL